MSVNPNRVLQLEEVKIVLDGLKGRWYRAGSRRRARLAVFRLSCCCGLRSKEIRGLRLDDFELYGPRPYITVRADNTKRTRNSKGESTGKARRVPLWWDGGTLEDIIAYHTGRAREGGEYFLCPHIGDGSGMVSRSALAQRWSACMSYLGPVRRRQLSIHCGRASFISHSLRAGRSVAEVMHAAGHTNPATTAAYMHALEREGVPDVFA